ncbi:MAG: GNAT family N-acetyltransferase [Terriglobia bacterium]
MAIEIVDIRLIEPRQFTPLLEAESSAWATALRWDYTPSARLIAACLSDKRLPGYALLSGGSVLGYSFFIYEGEKGLIGDLFVQPEEELHDQAVLLLENVIATLKATPGLSRIEAQLPHFAIHELENCFRSHEFQVFPRRFMALQLDRRPSQAMRLPFSLLRPAQEITAPDEEFVLDTWQRKYDNEAARLLYTVYRTHVDALINDQYQSVAGTSRLIENIIHLRGCGENLQQASRVLIHRPTQRLAGVLALTGVRPRTSHVPQIALANGFQGRGLGAVLMESSFRELDRLGYREVSLTVTDQNAGAVRWYDRLGFETFRTFGAFVWRRARD